MNKRESHINHLSAEEIQAYLEATLSDKQMHHIEHHLLNCDFCNEALEGYQEVPLPMDIANEIEKLNLLIDLRSKKKKERFPFLRIAAIGFVLILSAYFITVYFVQNKNIQISEKAPEKKEELIKKDSTTKINSEQPLKEAEEIQKKNTSSVQIKGSDEIKRSEEINHSYSANTREKTPAIPAEINAEDTFEGTILMNSNETYDSAADYAENENAQSEDLVEEKASLKKSKASGSLKGLVVDNESGEPIPFAAVFVKLNEEQVAGTATDIDGKFSLNGLDPEKYDLYVNVIGYNEKMVTDVLINADKITFQDIDVNAGVDIDAIEVVAYSVPLIDKDGGSSGGTVTSEDITNIPLRSASSVSSQVAGVDPDSKNKNVFKDAYPSIGQDEFNKYLENELIFPQEALEKSIDGIVKLRFTVDVDGTLSDFKILKSLGFGCDEEAIRLIKEGPEWNAAIKNGLFVKETVKIEVQFK